MLRGIHSYPTGTPLLNSCGVSLFMYIYVILYGIPYILERLPRPHPDIPVSIITTLFGIFLAHSSFWGTINHSKKTLKKTLLSLPTVVSGNRPVFEGFHWKSLIFEGFRVPGYKPGQIKELSYCLQTNGNFFFRVCGKTYLKRTFLLKRHHGEFLGYLSSRQH